MFEDVLAIAKRSSSFSVFLKPGIVTFFSAKAVSTVRCSSRVQLAIGGKA
jgi:hypothetical protein